MDSRHGSWFCLALHFLSTPARGKLINWDYKPELFSIGNTGISQESTVSRWLSEAKHHIGVSCSGCPAHFLHLTPVHFLPQDKTEIGLLMLQPIYCVNTEADGSNNSFPGLLERLKPPPPPSSLAFFLPLLVIWGRTQILFFACSQSLIKCSHLPLCMSTAF